MADARHESFMGLGPKRIAHWEHWSNPDAETYLTGIDHHAHPRQCRLKLQELYPELGLRVPQSDDPRPRPQEPVDQGHGRWGDAYRDHWQQDVASRSPTTRPSPGATRTASSRARATTAS